MVIVAWTIYYSGAYIKILVQEAFIELEPSAHGVQGRLRPRQVCRDITGNLPGKILA